MSARLGFARTLFLFDNQGLGFKPSSLGPAGVDRRRRRPRDVPALRRQRHGDARRQRPPLQRLHELHRRREPHQGARRAHAEGRLRGAHAARERVGGAQRRHVQLPRQRNAGAESQHRQQHGGLRLRVVAPRVRPAERRADPELEERRGQQLLLGLLRPGRLAGQLAADAQPRPALRHRRAAHGALQPDELLRSGCAVAARAAGARVPRSPGRRRVRGRQRAQPLPVQLGHQQHRAAPRRCRTS